MFTMLSTLSRLFWLVRGALCKFKVYIVVVVVVVVLVLLVLLVLLFHMRMINIFSKNVFSTINESCK